MLGCISPRQADALRYSAPPTRVFHRQYGDYPSSRKPPAQIETVRSVRAGPERNRRRAGGTRRWFRLRLPGASSKAENERGWKYLQLEDTRRLSLYQLPLVVEKSSPLSRGGKFLTSFTSTVGVPAVEKTIGEFRDDLIPWRPRLRRGFLGAPASHTRARSSAADNRDWTASTGARSHRAGIDFSRREFRLRG